MGSRKIEIYFSGSTVRPSAYIWLATILAVFMISFAVTPKTTSDVGSWRPKTKDRQGIVVAADQILRNRNPDIERANPCFNYDRLRCLVPPNIGA